jgi:uncharacterized membrane protein (UPF0127 family)
MDKNLKIRLTADTDEKRAKGLMFSTPLDDDEVALFIFPHMGRHAFWNKNVSYGLTLAFINDSGKIVDIADMDAYSTKSVAPSTSDVKFVVEAAQGALDRHGVSIGDMLDYSNNHQLTIRKASCKW